MRDRDLPPDPFGTMGLAEYAVMNHEMYLEFKKAGFTANQAMQLVCAAVTATFLRNSEEDA